MIRRKQVALAVLCIDFLLTLAAVERVLIAPPAPPPSVEQEGVFLLVVQWRDGVDVDVDPYIELPNGQILYFNNRSVGLLHLNRDDRGLYGDEGEATRVRRNEERVTWRGVEPGEYIVAAHLFRGGHATATFTLYKLRGPDRVLLKKTVSLKFTGDEETVFRATFTADEQVTNVSSLPKQLVGRTYG